MKNIEISLIKYMQDLYAHIYEGLMREIELDLIHGETYCMPGLEESMLSRCHFSPDWSISSVQGQAECQYLDVSWCLFWTLLTKPERPMPRESAVTEGVLPGYKLNRLLPSLKWSWGFHVALRIKFWIQAARNTCPVISRPGPTVAQSACAYSSSKETLHLLKTSILGRLI